MRWHRSWRFDPRAKALADDHYNRQTPDSPQFAPPGFTLVLLTAPADALWISNRQDYVRHAWPGAWVCTCFRNTNPRNAEHPDGNLSSELILEAIAATRFTWGPPPAAGMITFIDAGKVRRKRDVGRCYRRAGFVHVGFTGRGLFTFYLAPELFPEPEPAVGVQLPLLAV